MDKLEVARINRMLKFMFIRPCGIGNGIHMVRARASAGVGAIVSKSGEEASIPMDSLMNTSSVPENG